MAYIPVPKGVPGIRGLVQFRPETGRPLYELIQILLRGASGLTPAERELLAAYTSAGNGCMFCMKSHAAAARCLYGEHDQIVNDLITSGDDQSLSVKMKALLVIAGKARQNGKMVTQDDIDLAKSCGASEDEIHDTVLIVATFSLFNRYVDGLASFTPTEEKDYEEMGKRMSEKGYVFPTNKT